MDFLLKEDNDRLLQEQGDGILLSPITVSESLPWAPTYPVQLAPPSGLLTAAVPYLFFVQLVAAPAYNPAELGWLPKYEAPLEQPYSLGTTTPALQDEEPPFGWIPTYPVSFLVPSRHAPLAPFYFAPVTTPAPAQNVDEFAWRPTYPAQIDRAGPHASQQRAYFRPEHPLAASPPLAWKPTYPDRIDPPRGLTAPYQRATVLDPFPIAVPVDQLGWRGEWPDLLFRREVHAAQVPAYFKSPLPMAAAPPLSWGPVYPSWIAPARALGAALQRAVFFDPAPIAVPVPQLGWRGEYPDYIDRLDVHPSRVPSYFKSPLPMPAAPLLSWRPEYPVWIEPPRGLRAQYQRAFFADPFPIAVPVAALGWRGEWPEILFRREAHASQMPAYFKSPLPMPAAPLLSWRGEQPAWLPPRVLHPAHRPTIFRAPTLVAVPLSWAPDYPDQIHRRPWRDETIFTFVPSLTPVDQLAWRPSYQVWIPRNEVHASRVPSIFLPTGFQPAQAVPPLAWVPVYPDFARGDRIFRLELVAYLGTQTITPLPFAVEAHNVVFAVPSASGLLFTMASAHEIIITLPDGTVLRFTPDE